MRNWKSLYALFLLLCGLSASAYTQPNPELRKEFQNYIKQEVAPVLLEQQKALDARLSEDDLALVQEKRKEAAVLRAQREELMQKAREAVRSGADPQQVRANMRGSAQEIRTQSKDLFRSMRPFLENNRQLVREVMENLKPYYDEWVTEQQDILGKYRSEEVKRPPQPPRVGLFGLKPPRLSMGEKAEDFPPPPQRERAGRPHPRMRLALEFVLWDGDLPELPTEPPQHGLRNAQETAVGTAILDMQVFPNPAGENATLQFDLPKEVTNATLTILDAQGGVVRVEKLDKLKAGLHQQRFEVHDLAPGVYTCRLQAGDWTGVRQLLVQP